MRCRSIVLAPPRQPGHQVKAGALRPTPPVLSMTPKRRSRHGHAGAQSGPVALSCSGGNATSGEIPRSAGGGCNLRKCGLAGEGGCRDTFDVAGAGTAGGGNLRSCRLAVEPSPIVDNCCAATEAAHAVMIATAMAATRTSITVTGQSAFSIASALETSNCPGCSTLSALTTPSSTSIE